MAFPTLNHIRDPSSARNLNKDDVVIAVMGSTGTGKSSFTKLLSGNTTVRVGHSINSETEDVQVVRFLDHTSGHNVVLVDTPGFDDSRSNVSDTDILRKITKFLLHEYDAHRKLSGLIFVQRISDPRFGGQSSRNLRMFRNLCGTETYKNVVVVTTFWDNAGLEQQAARREEELKSTAFKDLVDGGACFMRHDRTPESAQRVLQHIFTLMPANVQIQKEIRLDGRALENTSAGSVYREEMEKILAKHNREVEELKSELAAVSESNVILRQELEEERARLQRELARWETEMSALKNGLDGVKRSQERLEANVAKKNQEQEHVRRARDLNRPSQLPAKVQPQDGVRHVQEPRKVEETKEKTTNNFFWGWLGLLF